MNGDHVITLAVLGFLGKLLYSCLPWFARQGEKVVDAWVARISSKKDDAAN